MRRPPKSRIFQEDELSSFSENDKVTEWTMLSIKHSPEGFQFKKHLNCVVYYNLVFDPITFFLSILESIKIDYCLCVALQYKGNYVPLLLWLSKGCNAKLTSLSMLENLVAYIKNTASSNRNITLDEINSRTY